jgi:hypothetical protein
LKPRVYKEKEWLRIVECFSTSLAGTKEPHKCGDNAVP